MNARRRFRVRLKKRSSKSHKGDYGRVFILAGSKGLAGAAHLAGMGALRSGAGLVTVGVPEKIYGVVARREAEVMVKPFASTANGSLSLKALPDIRRFLKTQDVCGLGPGLSQHPQTQKLIRDLVSKAEGPIVIDADGLNAFRGHEGALKKHRRPLILTPHPGEFQRLFGGKVSHDDAGRKKQAGGIAKQFGVVMILKGHRTVVAAPDGKIYRNTTGNPGMATGGTGDVLTGVVAALLGQGLKPFEAACAGVYIHGLAGDLAAKKVGQLSLTAGDIIQYLPAAIRKAV
ncbi:MAG: NAD(P)H-hydrate dehydratase [Candidatus Omnitrophota bacterium]|nr:NAD(P)H-hydrate dehydratase [Candidatus Omnitrophota bacterium]